MLKISFITFGCKVNYVETSTLERRLLINGYKKVAIKEYPDIVIINSCAVTEKAEKECIKLIKYLLNRQNNVLIIVIGCLVKLGSSKIEFFDNIYTFKSINEITDDVLKQMVNNKDNKQDIAITTNISNHINNRCYDNNKTESLFSLGDRTRSFLKIQDGCNYYCSYCTIPLARGHSRSPEINDIIDNINIIASHNVKEIVLTGINIGDYGIINGKRKYHFYDLLQKINELQHNVRYRISSIEPNLLTNEIIDLIKDSKTIVNHIPLQSGDNNILKLMHRRYSVDEYMNKILLVNSKIDNCCIGADVICGYPGENDEYFMNTHKVLEFLPISYFHVFPYSVRPDTLASKDTHQVDKTKKEQRVKQLLDLSKIKKTNYYKKNLGKTVDVLFEHSIDNQGYIYGYSQNYLRVKTKFNKDLVNKIHPVVVKNIDIKNLCIYFDDM